ncbi:DinB family protein [Mucilaginibacter terrenus]|uniref:DinB family protein n=1 Tax=Mucilaginibacter terrenus TaxID=2482727 RepID=A0A3E2NLE9_9SPHI|nr:DinB family protein [Mucilaginibacter terrenus]RFZ81798.1 DinB family protein [Mucilaginibacter terrenus]
MNLAKERRAIDEALDRYREWLDTIPDSSFDVTPAKDGWSYAEVYDHIMKASLGSSIVLERCTHDNCPPSKGGVTLTGWYILLMGAFPPFNTKVPEEAAAKVAPVKIDKETARNQIIKVRKRVATTAGLITAAPTNARWQHPRMGMLNAAQWFKFIRVHLQHHLKQLERLRASFNTSK